MTRKMTFEISEATLWVVAEILRHERGLQDRPYGEAKGAILGAMKRLAAEAEAEDDVNEAAAPRQIGR